MTIRITCTECASVLKIKDELAGTSGRCPKCKTKFAIPAAASGEKTSSHELSLTDIESLSVANADQRHEAVAGTRSPAVAEKNTGKSADPAERSPEKAAHRQASAKDSADFDDDDLDSPSVLIGVPTAETETKIDLRPLETDTRSTDSKKQSARPADKALKSSANAEKNLKLGAKKTPQSFDPMKFLMEDSPGQRNMPFSDNLQDDSDLSLPDDSNHDLMNRPTPQPVRKKLSSVISTTPTPEKVDLASAAKMMKKAIKAAQTESVRQRKLDDTPSFDFTRFFREIGVQGLAILVGCGLLVFGSIKVSNYVFRSSLKTPPLRYVRGTVKLNGQPLPNAIVFFAPRKPLDQMAVAGSKRERERTSVGMSDNNGSFKMMYSKDDNIEGVAVGKCLVWVVHTGERGNDVPLKWSEGAFNEVDVKADSQPWNLDIPMESDPKK